MIFINLILNNLNYFFIFLLEFIYIYYFIHLHNYKKLQEIDNI